MGIPCGGGGGGGGGAGRCVEDMSAYAPSTSWLSGQRSIMTKPQPTCTTGDRTDFLGQYPKKNKMLI